ncbi:DUF1501 domain-containing protein [Luteolibacter pohnpeiensis]|uniref:DUF1501 domain-containing protein n=1 Tax=Luteolibacter pohnpeiensis TaxID=454153 RepID=A0A934S2R7_9BACT|nr:DUF1501 domain-containing protein [Luteolibacter pohnpeiensis]MBK1881267.1 DUF1501 domain-containing protein [Luteolibacter pohnpeiensis]
MNPFNRADELTRRQFMSNAARTYLGVHLFPMLGGSIASAAPAKEIAAKARAKHVIYLYMDGGMSHVDTFDPKPKNKAIMGKTEAIPTNVDGIMVGHYLPNTAKVMDKLCVINSMNSTQGAHEQGSYVMHTSYNLLNTIQHPSLGAWVQRLGGPLHPDLPPFVAINTAGKRVGGGFFGAKFAAAPVGDPNQGLKDSKLAKEVGQDDFSRRLALADKMNRQFHNRYPNADVKAYEELYRDAINLMNSKDLKAFDLSQESEQTRKLYGSGRFAQGCLLARRLVQNDVRFVEVALGGWDTHYDNFAGVEGRCKEFDQAYAALITDLAACGKLQDTLVVVATEFGRTPELNAEHNNGRDHHPAAFSCVLAGGGVKGGMTHGLTDAGANKVKEGLVSVQDLNTTIGYALGLPYDLVLYSPSKRPFKMAGADKNQGKPVTELFS